MKRNLFWLALLPLLSCTESPRVDGDRAFQHLKQMVSYGPRIQGSEAITKTRAYIRKELESYGIKVEEHRFTAETPKGKVEMVNLLGIIPGEKPESIVIASHYDTKNIGNPPCPGANDGASSTALVLEIAKQLSTREKGKLSIRFAFFDGEEAFESWSETDGTYGSRALVKKWEEEKIIPTLKALILLDMIGDSDLEIAHEVLSSEWIVKLVRESAKELKCDKYFFKETANIEDDHRPFLKAGVPSIDLIDIHYGPEGDTSFGAYWHTKEDKVEHCSVKSLQITGDVVLKSLGKIEDLVK